MTSHCTFCDLIHGAAEVSVCYEDADAIAFMDIQPVNTGHVLVVPRQHLESLFDVPPELGAHLFGVTMRVANAVRRVTGCEDMNIVVNSGQAAGQDVFHYHVHIIPRRPEDGFDIQLPFPGSQMPQREVLDMAAARIIAALNDPMRSEGEGSGGAADGQGSGEQRAAPAPRAAAERVVSLGARAEGLADVAPRPAGPRSPVTSPATAPRDGDAWAGAREGAHGELVRET